MVDAAEAKTRAITEIHDIPDAALSAPLKEAVRTIANDVPVDSVTDYFTTKSTTTQNATDIANTVSTAVNNAALFNTMVRNADDYAGGEILSAAGNYGGKEIVSAAEHLAFDGGGKLPENARAALKALALAGGLSIGQAEQAIGQLEKGERERVESNKDHWYERTDEAKFAQAKNDLEAVEPILQEAINKGLRQDILTNSAGDGAAIAKLPAKQLDLEAIVTPDR